MLGTGIGFLTIGSKEEDDDDESRVRGGILNVSYNDGDNDDSDSATLYGAKVGGAMFIGDRTSLDLFIDYSGTSSSDSGFKTTTSVFGVGAGLSYFLK